MFIYKITNKLSGKMYVGMDTGPVDEGRRWYQHRSYGSGRWKLQSKGCLIHLYRAMRKDGIDNFSYEVIDQADDELLLREREVHWIAHYGAFGPNGYNLTPGGDDPHTYRYLSEERRIERNRLAGAKRKAAWERLTDEERAALAVVAGEKSRAAWAAMEPEVRAERIRRIAAAGKEWHATATPEQKEAATANLKASICPDQRRKAKLDHLARETPEQRERRITKAAETTVSRRGTPAMIEAQKKKAASYSATYAAMSEEERSRLALLNKKKSRDFWEMATEEVLSARSQKIGEANRSRFANMTPEEKEAFRKKISDTKKARKEERKTPPAA